jgi:hypothetical protein
MQYLLFFNDNNVSTKAAHCHVIPTLPALVTNMAVFTRVSLFKNAVKNWTFTVLNEYKDVKYVNQTYFGVTSHQLK